MTRSIDLDPRSRSQLGSPGTPTEGTLSLPGTTQPATLVTSGSPESVIAAALLALEAAEDREEVLRAEATRQRFHRAREAIRDRHRANALELTAGLLSGVADIAKGISSFIGGDAESPVQKQPTGQGGGGSASANVRLVLATTQMASNVSSTIGGFFAKKAGLDGEMHDLESQASAQAAQRAERGRDEADQSADRMLDAMREIGRLRHEAALAALRTGS